MGHLDMQQVRTRYELEIWKGVGDETKNGVWTEKGVDVKDKDLNVVFTHSFFLLTNNDDSPYK